MLRIFTDLLPVKNLNIQTKHFLSHCTETFLSKILFLSAFPDCPPRSTLPEAFLITSFLIRCIFTF